MIWKILFILSGWLYFIFEGITETEVSTYNSNRYHIWRVFENLGIITAFHIVFITTALWRFIPLFWLTTLSGLCLYEMVFSLFRYGNPLYNKTSLWLGLKHPKGWMYIPIFIIATIILAIIM